MSAAANIPSSEFAERCARAAEAARHRGLDGLLFWSRGTVDSFHDVYYLSRHLDPTTWVPPSPPLMTGLGHAGLILTGDGHSTLLVSDFCAGDVQVDEVRASLDLCGELVASVERLGLSAARLGVVNGELFPYSFGRALQDACPAIRLQPADDLSPELRRRLSDAEMDMLEHAAAVGMRIYEAALSVVAPGATEGAVIGAGQATAATILGCTHWSFLAAGPDASKLYSQGTPPWQPDYVYEPGDVIHYDCFGFVFGYAYDLARTIVVGREPAPDQAHVIDTTADACATMARALTPGITCAEVYEEGRAVLSNGGLVPAGGGFGHGLGCGFLSPYIWPEGRDADFPLEPPCALSFEVFATDGNDLFAYHEDNYLFTAGGVKCITRR